MRNTSGYSSLPRGNRWVTSNKPSTERTSVQGCVEYEEVSFPDQNCKSQDVQHSGVYPRDGHYSHRFELKGETYTHLVMTDLTRKGQNGENRPINQG